MSNDSYPIRDLLPEDLKSVYDIYLAAHLDEYMGEEADFHQKGIPDSPALIELFDQCQIIVYDDGKAKGFAGYQGEKIIWLYVHPEHRGQKVGKKLIEFMLARLMGEVTISVVKSNKPALRLYLQKGFKVFGDFSFAYQGVPVEVYRMKLLLPG